MILPDATILLDYMLVKMTGLVDGLVVRSERMRENIARGLGLHASSRVLLALVDDGGDERARTPTRSSSARRCAPPTRARRCATCSRWTRRWRSGSSLARLDACFDDALFLQHVPEVIARLDRLDRVAVHPPSRPTEVPDGLAAEVLPAVGQGPRPVRAADGRLAARRLGPDLAPSTSSCRPRSRTRAAS